MVGQNDGICLPRNAQNQCCFQLKKINALEKNVKSLVEIIETFMYNKSLF